MVYGQPAIALPIAAVEATATIVPGAAEGSVVEAPDLGLSLRVDEQPDHPIVTTLNRTLATLGVTNAQPLKIVLQSTIPIASGMGSGAAASAALVRALAAYYRVELDPATVSALVYESERFYHGTPSGIDNTIVSYGRPIWFQRDPAGGPPRLAPLLIKAGFTLVIGDTGIRAPTRIAVAGVRERRNADPDRYERLFVMIGQTVTAVRDALRAGDLAHMGSLLTENQRLLEQIGVSSAPLDGLVHAAQQAGALGAKLSGGGGGGIMLALAPHDAGPIETALHAAGAARIITAYVAPSG